MKYLKVILALLALVLGYFVIGFIFWTITTNYNHEEIYKDIMSIPAKDKLMENKLDSLSMIIKSLNIYYGINEKTIANLIERLEKINYDNTSRISKIENENRVLIETVLSLRQSINPVNPEEILTIARLNDKVTELNNNIKNLESKLDVKQKYFEDSIIREMNTLNNYSNLIIALLVPFILSFLYQLWRDLKKTKTEKEVKELSSNEN